MTKDPQHMALAQTIETRIRTESKTKFATLNLADEFIAPNYSGRSIVNIPATIARILGSPMHTPALDAEMTTGLDTDVQRVVLVIVDALGYKRLLDTLAENPQNGFHALLRNGARLVPITSVFPSTTTAALTALWSGYTPAEHGFVGYQLFLREYGVRANMISFSPTATDHFGAQQLVNAGLEPEKFLPVPALPQTLVLAGVPTYNLIETPYIKSALSRVQIRGIKETFGVITSSDMWLTLGRAMEQHIHERALFVAYWSALDGIQHNYGASSDAVIAEVNNLAYSFEREFLKSLSPAARKGTLFLLTADHGQIDSPVNRALYLNQHPALIERLVMNMAGEPRAAYFYCRQGEKDAVIDYLTLRLADTCCVLDSQMALDAGLFGTGTLAPEIKYRIGDVMALPRQNFYLWDRTEEPRMLGRHGGLAEKEMLVPLMLARLDN